MQPDGLLLDSRHAAFLQGKDRRLLDPKRFFVLTLGIYAALFIILGMFILIAAGVGLSRSASADNSARNLLILGMLFILGASVVFAWIIPHYRRHNCLAREGQIIEGRVISSERKYASRAPYLAITYHFTSPQGHDIRGTLKTSRLDLWQNPPPYWSLIAVVYLDETLYQVL
jgi:hypothetical protein